jgi:hypothetical protein
MSLSYALFRGSNSPFSYAMKLTQNNGSSTTTDTANTTDDVMQVTLFNPTQAELRSGLYSGGFPAQDSTRPRRKYTIADTAPAFSNSTDIYFFMSAVTVNSAGNFVSTVTRMKVEVLMPNGVAQGSPGVTGAVGPGRFTYAPTTVFTNYQATFWQRIKYIPSGAFTIYAPTGAAVGDQFSTKNVSNFGTTVTVHGNGSDIEPPAGGYTLSPTAPVGLPGSTLVWEFDGTNWGLV